MAYAFLSPDPQEAKRLLADAPGIKRSPVGLVIQGFLNLFDAWGGNDAKAAESAIKDFEYVQFFFNDNPASLGFRLLALESGVRIARSEGRYEDVDRYAREGRLLAEQLAEVEHYPAGDWSRQKFYLAIGEEEAAWQAIRKVGQHQGTYSWFLAAHCVERYGIHAIDEFEKAMALEHWNGKYIRLARAYLLMDTAEAAPQVRNLVGDMLNDPSPFLRRHALLHPSVRSVNQAKSKRWLGRIPLPSQASGTMSLV